MNTRVLARDGESRGMWVRLWEAVHGPLDLTASSEHDALWSKLRELEAAAAELSALEGIETHRARDGDTSDR